MKRNSILTGIAVSVVLSAFLTGCGSSGAANTGSKTDDTNKLSTTTVNGKAVDGYLQYATVCLDLSKDGYCQDTEPSTQTDDNGAFTLKLTDAVQKDPNFETAMLLVYGGKDVDTGNDFIGKLLAPKDGANVVLSPVSTLVAKQLQKEIKGDKKLTKEEIKAKVRAAKEKVAQALDIPADELDKDPIAEQTKGNDKLIKKSLQLQKSIEAMLAAEPDQSKRDERAEKIYEALADSLDDMDPQNRGVDQLLNKTLQKATQDQQIKTLLGGDRGLKVGDAAKKIAQTIGKRFDDADESVRNKKDFLKKIAVVTEEDLKKVKVAVEDGKEDEIAGQISVEDGLFKPGYDWSKKFLSHDLGLIGVTVTPQLIDKIKTLLGEDTEIEPGMLFKNAEKLKESDDTQLQDIYQKIEKFIAQKNAEKEEHEAVTSDKIIPLNPPMSFYLPDHEGYGKVSLSTDNKLSFQKYKIQEDGTFAAQTDDDGDDTEFFLQNGQWTAHAEDEAEPFVTNEDGSILSSLWKEKIALLEGKAISGQTITLPQYGGLSVPMPADAKMYFVRVESTNDVYSIDEEAKDYSVQPPAAITSFGDFIKNQCSTNWFMGGQNGGLAFAGTQNEATGTWQCDTTATEGKLVHVYKDNTGETHTGKIAGEWKIQNVDGVDIMVVKPYNTDYIKDDEGEIDYPIFALKDGKLYRGGMEPKGVKRMIPAYNKAALDTITSTLTSQWENLKKNMPSGMPTGN